MNKVMTSSPPQKRMFAVGGICVTTIYGVDHLPPAPAKLLADRMNHLVDGMALSAAYAFTKLGGEALICGRVGDDVEGRAMRHSLQAEGFDTTGLHTVAGTTSSRVAVIVDEKGDRVVVVYHDKMTENSPEWLPLDRIRDAGIVHCDLRWPEGARRSLETARALGVPTMIDGDVAPRPILLELVPLADYAVFSDAGLLRYTGCTDVESALRQVGARREGHVGASCGRLGYFWYDDGDIRHAPAPDVEVVDTLSAGDVFHGAFALAILEGRTIEEAARFACACASLKCTRFGGRLGCPTRDEVDRLLATT